MNYYNENDPKAAAWLRVLIKQGSIPSGEVDERSIKDVEAKDLEGYTQCHFFAGIGGWSEALRLASWAPDRSVWTGSCPCQSLSVAGARKGHKDKRHLWPEFCRLICECLPPVVFGEQVASPLGRQWLAGIRSDLEEMGYGVGAADLCAAGVCAPHIRQRLFWVADSDRERQHGERVYLQQGGSQQEGAETPWSSASGGVADAGFISAGRGSRPENQRGGRTCGEPPRSGASGGVADSDGERGGAWGDSRWLACQDGRQRRIPIEPAFFPLAHGSPGRVAVIEGLGNAIVPQVASEFVKVYMDTKGVA